MDLDELKRLLAAATHGPWRAEAQDPERNEGFPSCIISAPDSVGDDYAFVDVSNERDAALIVAAVNALLDLIAEIEHLREAYSISEYFKGEIEVENGQRAKRIERLGTLDGLQCDANQTLQAHIRELEAALRYYSEICDCQQKGIKEPHDEACHLQRARAALESTK